jgi:uncharacterized protein (TIGR03435 family)
VAAREASRLVNHEGLEEHKGHEEREGHEGMRKTMVISLVVLSGWIRSAPEARRPSQSASTFEVASVKRSAPDARGMMVSGPAPSGFRTINAPLSTIIQYAYGIADYQLVHAPAWVRSERFDITAKYPEGDDRSRVPEMVQALLAGRFALKTHKEVRAGPIFELVTVRDDRRLGPQLRRTEIDCVAFYASLKESGKANVVGPDGRPTCMMIASNQFIRASGRTMEILAANLARQLGRRVVDRTGLTGDFDFDLEWSPDIDPARAPAPPAAAVPQPSLDVSIYTALREQLGLELKTATGPIDVIVIDSVMPPTLD